MLVIKDKQNMTETTIRTELYKLKEEVKNLKTSQEICMKMHEVKDFIEENGFQNIYENFVQKYECLYKVNAKNIENYINKFKPEKYEIKEQDWQGEGAITNGGQVYSFIITECVPDLLYFPDMVGFMSPLYNNIERYLQNTFPGIVSLYNSINSCLWKAEYNTPNIDLFTDSIDFYILDKIIRNEYIINPTSEVVLNFDMHTSKYFNRWGTGEDYFWNCWARSALFGVLEVLSNQTFNQDNIKTNTKPHQCLTSKETEVFNNIQEDSTIKSIAASVEDYSKEHRTTYQHLKNISTKLGYENKPLANIKKYKRINNL